jgi:hypothetical protein
MPVPSFAAAGPKTARRSGGPSNALQQYDSGTLLLTWLTNADSASQAFSRQVQPNRPKVFMEYSFLPQAKVHVPLQESGLSDSGDSISKKSEREPPIPSQERYRND